MIPTPLAHTLMKSAGTGTEAAIGIAGVVGKKLIRAGLAAGKTAPKVTFTFIQGGIEALRNSENGQNPDLKFERLSKSLRNGSLTSGAFAWIDALKIHWRRRHNSMLRACHHGE